MMPACRAITAFLLVCSGGGDVSALCLLKSRSGAAAVTGLDGTGRDGTGQGGRGAGGQQSGHGQTTGNITAAAAHVMTPADRVMAAAAPTGSAGVTVTAGSAGCHSRHRSVTDPA